MVGEDTSRAGELCWFAADDRASAAAGVCLTETVGDRSSIIGGSGRSGEPLCRSSTIDRLKGPPRRRPTRRYLSRAVACIVLLVEMRDVGEEPLAVPVIEAVLQRGTGVVGVEAR